VQQWDATGSAGGLRDRPGGAGLGGSPRSNGAASGHDRLESDAAANGRAVAAGDPMRRVRPTLRTPTIQRIPFGERVARFFGGGTFPTEELQRYLRFLDDHDQIEDHYDSDNKAREVVERWRRGDSRFLLTRRRKVLLIREMISGYTGTDDENAILALLRGSSDADFARIVSSVGRSTLEGDLHGESRRRLDAMLNSRLAVGRRAREEEARRPSRNVFPAEAIVPLQRLFTSNAELAHDVRQNCIEIVRSAVPQLFAHDRRLAERVAAELGALRGGSLKMTEAGRVLADLGVASGPTVIRFNGGNGLREPTEMRDSAWDAITDAVGREYGWHVFGMAVFNGYHSVTVFVDNRPDGPRVYWADQWAIGPGEDFHQAPGSVSGFRRYERDGFDRHINELTNRWWRKVLDEKGTRYEASLKIWRLHTRPAGGGRRR
ncbi:MAG: hypothetical protein ACODAE_01785, partial [Gemmatimonadota bacterium]